MALGWAGLLSMVSVGVLVDVQGAFPGWIALWPLLSAAAIIVAGRSGSPFGLDRILTYKDKRGRDLEHLRAELLRLMALVESVVTTDAPWARKSTAHRSKSGSRSRESGSHTAPWSPVAWHSSVGRPVPPCSCRASDTPSEPVTKRIGSSSSETTPACE